MSGDFTKSTDFLEHDISYKICERYLLSAGILSDYCKSYLRLLCSPRVLNNKITKRGILMGDAGSKVVLTIMTRVVYQTYRQEVQSLSGII